MLGLVVGNNIPKYAQASPGNRALDHIATVKCLPSNPSKHVFMSNEKNSAAAAAPCAVVEFCARDRRIRPRGGHPQARRHAFGDHPLPAGAERLPARGPRQIDLPELRPGARLPGPLQPAFRRYQSRKRKTRNTSTPSWTASSGWAFRLGARRPGTPALRQRLFRQAVRDGRVPDQGAGKAYVDSQSAEDMSRNRGNFGTPGTNSPFRNRPVEESLQIFRDMKAGKYKDGEHILRAKMSEDAMASPNMTNRDPALYRIRHAHHHRTGDKWCIYPMYDYTHPISDALENITHSLCTLEFQDHRPFYDWLVDTLADGGFFQRPVPRQYEFSRLNLTYVVTSQAQAAPAGRRKHRHGWDDPRMPTIVGLRRRGYTPESIQLFCERIGVSKADGWIDMSTLEGSLRDDLDPKAPRAIAVLRPLKLIVDNFPKARRSSAARRSTRTIRKWAPHLPVHANCGSSRKTSWKSRPRATSASARRRRQAGRARAPEVRLRGRVHRLRQGCGRQCDRGARATISRIRNRARRARTTTRSRATSPGSAPRTRWKPKCACTTACSATRSGGRTGRAAARTSRPKLLNAERVWKPSTAYAGAGPARGRQPSSASSSSATAISWPTASIRQAGQAGVQPRHHAEGQLGKVLTASANYAPKRPFWARRCATRISPSPGPRRVRPTRCCLHRAASAQFRGIYGYDLMSNHYFGDTLEGARQKVRLQASGTPIDVFPPAERYLSGLRMPVYRIRCRLDTIEQRRAAYIGSVGIAFSVPKLTEGRWTEFRCRDAPDPAVRHRAATASTQRARRPARTLFDSRGTPALPRPRSSGDDMFSIVTCRWTSTTAPGSPTTAYRSPRCTPNSTSTAELMMAVGFIGSMLLLRPAPHADLVAPCALELAKAMTSELRESQNKLQLSHQKLRRLADHAYQIKELERKRIAREIHDDLGQNLLALRIEAEMLATRTRAPPPACTARPRHAAADRQPPSRACARSSTTCARTCSTSACRGRRVAGQPVPAAHRHRVRADDDHGEIACPTTAPPPSSASCRNR
jgi:hypothetical protein